MNKSFDHKLSIVVPCYNCADTLEQAIASVYTQHITIPFEVILVNDASTDATQEIIEKLAREQQTIRHFTHKKNLGGGAARNTGIAHAEGTLIYCLDSDNFFAQNSLQELIDVLIEQSLDGVAFHERRFFQGNNSARYNSHFNTILKRDIKLADLFNETGTLLDNFLYTKEAYLQTAGYPEHHGFDTQCFEVRFLSAGHRVRSAQGSVFYHRQHMRQKSYFEREVASGKFSLNYMLICEDIFHLFTPDMQDALITFPLLQDQPHGEDLLALLKRTARSNDLFTPEHTTYCIPNGMQRWIHDHTPPRTEREHLTHALFYNTAKDFMHAGSALHTYISLSHQATPYIELLGLRVIQGLAGISYNDILTVALTNISGLNPRKHRSISSELGRRLLTRNPLLHATAVRIKKIIFSL